MVGKKRNKKKRKLDGGDCYETAANLLLFGNLAPNAVLVHGYPTLTRPPFIKFGHAWIEIENPGMPCIMVIDRANGNNGFLPQPMYYSIGNIDDADNVRYTREEARKMMLEHKHYGPW